jgi:uncharacterized membrane protein
MVMAIADWRLRIADLLPRIQRLRRRATHPRSAIGNPPWLFDRRGDMIWSTVILATVVLPLAGLAIDAPRYFALRSRLQIAADAAAEAAARAVDVRHFATTGETRLQPDACSEAGWAFTAATGDLAAKGYSAHLVACQVDEAADTVATQANGTLRLFYNLSPPFTARVQASSRFRMIRR